MDEILNATLEVLGNGMMVNDVNTALNECFDHCRRHPTVKKPRKVLLEITVEPDYDVESGHLEFTLTHFAKAGFPKMAGRKVRAVDRNGTAKIWGNMDKEEYDAGQMNVVDYARAQEKTAK